MAVAMLDPQPGERLLDPACGTGGFLITAMNHALEILEAAERSEWADWHHGSDAERDQLGDARRRFLAECVHGLDLNPGLVRAAKMNMVMNNDGSGGLWQANSLAHSHSWTRPCAAAVRPDSFDVIVTNPPFGANIVIDDPLILSQYETAAVWDNEPIGWVMRRDGHGTPVFQKSQPPEILFIERCVQLLKPGSGRMAMVIPNGILNNPALGYVRHWLLTNTQVLAVVDMARELFQPKNDTQTSMLLVRRLTVEQRRQAIADGLDYPIFMAVTDHIGHDKRGNVLYRRNADGEDIVVERTETVREIDPASGEEVLRDTVVAERLVDDDLAEVAVAYRQWLTEQT
jgi:type I restriction enzyme M protein